MADLLLLWRQYVALDPASQGQGQEGDNNARASPGDDTVYVADIERYNVLISHQWNTVDGDTGNARNSLQAKSGPRSYQAVSACEE